MEAERVASEVPAEPDRVALPAPVLLHTAPAESVRSLSRAYGNRRVVALLQRQPLRLRLRSPGSGVQGNWPMGAAGLEPATPTL